MFLNQLFILNHAIANPAVQTYPPAASLISCIAAVLKSLSPIGKKLTSMLALAMQGLLFNSCCLMFRFSFVGRLLGAALSSLWGIMQPLLLYYLIFGNALFATLEGFNQYLHQALRLGENASYYFLGGLIILKIILAWLIVFFTPRFSSGTFEAYTKNLFRLGQLKKRHENFSKQSLLQQAFAACKDLCRLTFLVSWAATVLFFYSTNYSGSVMIWLVFRPLAIGFIVFFASRAIPFERLEAGLRRRNSIVGKAFEIALQKTHQS